MSSRFSSNVPIGLAAIAGLLLATGPAGAQVQDQKLMVQARIGDLCTVNAASLDFGTYAMEQLNKSGSININCITPTAVNVALDGGHAGNGGGLRTMSNGGSNLIYGLFKQPGGAAWETDQSVLSPSSANHSVPVHGQILPTHNPGPFTDGLYTDEVTITLTFQ
jgi:spore coat protein U-like protein